MVSVSVSGFRPQAFQPERVVFNVKDHAVQGPVKPLTDFLRGGFAPVHPSARDRKDLLKELPKLRREAEAEVRLDAGNLSV